MRLIIEKGKNRRKIELIYGNSKVLIGIDGDNLVVFTSSNLDSDAVKKYIDENLEEIVQDIYLITHLAFQLAKKIVSAGKVKGEIHAR